MVGYRGKGELDTKGSLLSQDWKDPSDAPAGNEVVNCEIRRCGLDSRGGCGIFIAFTADTRITHNHIHDMPYTGISVGFRWDLTPSPQERCVVDYNHLGDKDVENKGAARIMHKAGIRRKSPSANGRTERQDDLSRQTITQ